ncbi:MAG TPA: sulfite exporter TauE/SafE family protein [Saprospiraceae bacterium]|jgi:uncharacterized protein
MPGTDILFYVLLPLVAFLYASVGHGGASGYLALMAIFAFVPDFMRPAALLLNVAVSLIAFIQYYRQGHFDWRLFWPFAIASIPAAFLGGLIDVEEDVYKKVLGVLLILSVIRLLDFRIRPQKEKAYPPVVVALGIGAAIGFLSGLIGIGGGIILSPIILLLHWADMKKTAAVSALFIFVNSIAGLAGLWTKGFALELQMVWMLLLAFAGGTFGAYLGAGRFENKKLKWILAVVLVIASVKLLTT